MLFRVPSIRGNQIIDQRTLPDRMFCALILLYTRITLMPFVMSYGSELVVPKVVYNTFQLEDIRVNQVPPQRSTSGRHFTVQVCSVDIVYLDGIGDRAA